MLIVGSGANIEKLIQLYIVGVFTSFTLSQLGRVRHWRAVPASTPDVRRRRAVRRSQAINATGAVVTGLVLLIVVRCEFLAGAHLAIAAMTVLSFLVRAVRRHHDAVTVELAPGPGGVPLPSRTHALVLVSRIHAPTLRALAYAAATRPHDLTALTVAVNDEESRELQAGWDARGTGGSTCCTTRAPCA